MSSELTDFFKKKKKQDESEKIDWQKNKDEWLETISTFNEQIITWLKDPLDNDFVKYNIEYLNINEYLFGNYQAPSIVITSGNDKVYFKPIEKFVLGFNGRIDIISFTDSKTLVYVNKEKGWFLFDQNKKGNLKPFTEKLFTELLQEMFS
ncbi:MAG: hypothetical protein AABZ74_17600 [Cyanobacteriota bacterium]